MKQLKLFLLLTIGALFAVSCGDDADDSPKTTSIDIVLDNSDQIQKEVDLKGLSAENVKIENNNSWLTVTHDASNNKILISVADNTSNEKRVGIVTVKDAKENTIVVNITQPGFAGKLFTQSLNVSGFGDEKVVTLTDLTSAIKDIKVDVNWLAVEQYSNDGATAPSVKVKAEANTTEDIREAKVIINATNGDRVTLTVTQNVKEGSNVEEPNDTESDQPAYSRQK